MSTSSNVNRIRARGHFSDGETAASHEVDVELEANCLRLTSSRRVALSGGVADGESTGETDGPQTLVWPYVALTAEPSIGRGATNVLLGYKHQPDAALYIEDAGFLAALRARVPRLSSRAQRTRWMMPIAVTMVVIVAIYGLLLLSGLSISQGIAGMIPERARIAAGTRVSGVLTAQRPVCTDLEGQKVLDQLTARLVPSGEVAGVKLRVGVIKWGIANALAGPGGIVYLTSGLLRTATSPEEVAGVLAHEIGHAQRLHPEANLVRSLGISAAVQVLLGGGGGAISGLGAALVQNSYAREAEREADAIAVNLLRRAAISHRPLMAFFRRNSRRGAGLREAMQLLSTHPLPRERLQMLARIPVDYETQPALSNGDWRKLRRICRSVDAKAENGKDTDN